ncbi:CD48 antigen-like isoform X2 [Hemiscyllium ocellatum]|uniref:CD48 antigen-like isoform X2 n=1 Tax=Hemiscyllium ocellatum TaxID=170820 RepID=UPI0029672B05|nr:CD48 antigen-like isoform X2 [Hemiscyllium ocellatum]
MAPLRAAATAALLVILALVSKCGTIDVEIIYGFLNHSISLPLSKPTGVSEIVFKLNNHKVFEWENMETNYFGSFSQKLKYINGSVLIPRLQKEDTGTYTVDFIFSNGTIRKDRFFLKVLEPLAIPEAICIRNDSVVTLMCGLNNEGADITIEWKYHDTPVTPSDDFVLTNENKSLTISSPHSFSGVYTCIAKQPKDSSQSAPLLLSKCLETEGNGRNRYGLILSVLSLVAFTLFLLIEQKCKSKTEDRAPHQEYNKVLQENRGEMSAATAPTKSNNESEERASDLRNYCDESSQENQEELTVENPSTQSEPKNIDESAEKAVGS